MTQPSSFDFPSGDSGGRDSRPEPSARHSLTTYQHRAGTLGSFPLLPRSCGNRDRSRFRSPGFIFPFQAELTAGRKPRLLFRLSGVFLLRFADRQL